MTIEDFLRARLEDDAVRADAARINGVPFEPYPYEQVVADIRAKSRILANLNWLMQQRSTLPSAPIDQSLGSLKEAIHHMAEIYSDHPDYDPLWKL
ncbi:DUF6221 family protein [Nocardiopsis chromatogenes]|uniref:DUF6221 family protein n=1 Tax=Nocardiopsis chromatogenes TaxID=280239 RepID=UPI00037BB5DB|nr:DUF6221 family protein [Nocardiopsis chromatogenes]